MTRRAVSVAASAWLAAAILGLLAGWRSGLADPPVVSATDDSAPISPVPLAVALDEAKVRLGGELFHDRRLSHGDRVACVSCHRLEAGGDDNRTFSPGTDGQPLDFNTPTIFNATLSFRLNWRGNFHTIEEQNEAVLVDPRLMNTSWAELLAKLRADATYRSAFGKAYGGPPERAYVLDALAAFQRSLLTPDARFDRFLRGEHDAITAQEKRGYELFQAYGCAACHQGVNVGGNLFQKFGIFEDPFAWRSEITKADLGRFAITGDKNDRHVFRVPSLRNIALTAPYFHDGRTDSLPQAVEIMARNQLGRTLAPQEVEDIVKFLDTLTGAYRSGHR